MVAGDKRDRVSLAFVPAVRSLLGRLDRLDRDAGLSRGCDEPIEERVVRHAHCRHCEVGKFFAVGLCNVENRNDLEAGDHRALFGVVNSVVVGDSTDERGDDADAAFAFADVSAELLPGAKPGDSGCVGTLRGDEELVVEAVGAELGGHVEPVLPAVAGAQCLDLFGECAEQFGAFVVVHGGLLVG